MLLSPAIVVFAGAVGFATGLSLLDRTDDLGMAVGLGAAVSAIVAVAVPGRRGLRMGRAAAAVLVYAGLLAALVAACVASECVR